MSYDIGDVARTLFTVRDVNDVLTNATVTHVIQKPDGTEIAGTVVNDSTGRYHADIAIDAAGTWRWEFIATGAATGREPGALVAVAQWSGPVPWVPSLREIADYVPTRTVPVNVAGSATPLGTFDTTTIPNDEAVTRIGQSAAAWVVSKAGDVDATLYDMARSVAAIRAAAFIELAYPQRDGEISVYETLFEQANLSLDQLVTANVAAGEDSPAGSGGAPVWSFPTPSFDSDTYPLL